MTERKPLSECLVKPGEKRVFANLTVDLAFKKAFDPDGEIGKSNLIHLLNDLLGPQLKRPVADVSTRNAAQNASGSSESRTAIFDLHCSDDMGNLFEIEVQIHPMTHFLKRLAYYAGEMVVNQAETGAKWNFNAKPTYVIAFTRFDVFKNDNRAVHRATLTDLETGAQFVDTYNFAVFELSKIPCFIQKDANEIDKWLFFLGHSDQLKELPEELDETKFDQLTEVSRVANFSRKELEAYQMTNHAEWDLAAQTEAFIEDHPDVVAKLHAEGEAAGRAEGLATGRAEERREMAKGFRDAGVPLDVIAKQSGLTEEEIKAL